MKIFYTSATQHLAHTISTTQGRFITKYFSDKELEITLIDQVKNTPVHVVGSTQTAPDIIELLLLLDTLKNAGAQSTLTIPYFGYARQDKIIEGSSCGARLLAQCIRAVHTAPISIIHAHSSRLQEFLAFNHVIPYELFLPVASLADILVCPDEGSIHFAQQLALRSKKPFISLTKNRSLNQIDFSCNEVALVKNKHILIVDDMISSGATMLGAAEYLHNHGALSINALATHGLFTNNAQVDFEQSTNINNVWVTDTIYQRNNSSKIHVLSVGKWLEEHVLNK